MKIPKSLYLSEIVEYGVAVLLKNGISNAKKEIEWVCKKKINIPNLFLIKKNKTISVREKKILSEFISRRKKQEPFQYIIEQAPFYNQDFYRIKKRIFLWPSKMSEFHRLFAIHLQGQYQRLFLLFL